MQRQLSHEQHSSIRQRALQQIEQDGDADTMHLLRINRGDDDINSNKAATASTAVWKLRAEEILAEIGQEKAEKASNAVETESRTVDTNEDLITKRIFPASATTENDSVSRIRGQTHNTSSELYVKEVVGSLKYSLQSIELEVHKQAEAELHTRSVKLLPTGETKERALKCIGWRNTGDDRPNGPREPHEDLTCSEFVPNNASGYCEVEDTQTGEHFRVMRRSAHILRNRVPFRCINAPAFARFRVQAHAAMTNPTSATFALPNVGDSELPPRDGIVMVVYPKLVPSAYATIRVLRDVLGCSLPIEVWFRPDEMKDAPEALVPLRLLAQNSSAGQISFHPISDPVAKRFVAKIYAIYNSFFDRVLFLDADNVPVRDPSFLFDSPEFVQSGAVFWPDFWHPASTMFGLHRKSLLWELLDMPFVDMFEQESGQLVVDRRKHGAPLKLVLFYATHDPNFLVHYKLAWGDKDLFRLAWLKLNATFHMIEAPPAMAGMVTNLSVFCGMTMVQHDAAGEILFLHRNKHKLTGIKSGGADANSSEAEAGLEPDPAIWTHLLSFDRTWSRGHYVVQAFTTSLTFTSKQKCFGRRSLRYSPQFYVQDIANQTFAGLETHLRHFAKQAADLEQT
ncbi:hypothetical protein PHYPSEUDO_005794 [Phytophthora pseudosyringae]|uniref:Uncharacterized protein n=1 Tax=Phytophthora pseudosyringae TaxID=221518 RepID=A0A8T1VL37_9STRA|nr:hypothetical protein PHYPSEUDO_005794 [Phytophthora pseudosyringae]